VNAETVLKILETEWVVYRRLLELSCHVLLCPASLQLFYRRSEEETGVAETLWSRDKNGKIVVRRPVYYLGEEIPARFANLLSNWNRLYKERRWAKDTPSLGEVTRAVNAYCSATGYRLFTLLPGEPLSAAVPYAPPEPEEMHLVTGYDS
jgi:hypothetical protein